MTARQVYDNAVAKHYVRLPGTPLRASRRDRRLAGALYDRRVALKIVWAAFVTAAARWAIRSPQLHKLATIRTLHYFVPAIDEMLETSPDPDYVQYLAGKLRPFVAEKERRLAAPSSLP